MPVERISKSANFAMSGAGIFCIEGYRVGGSKTL